jgi:hypothetical protein
MFKRVLARIGLRGIVPAAAALGLAMVVAPAPAQAATGNVTCTTTIDNTNTVITGNVTVPAGASCTLNGGTVQGNVHVGAGASLTLESPTVQGSVHVVAGAFLGVYSATVQGNVHVGAGASLDVGGSIMQHNLTTEGASWINIVSSQVWGNSSFDATSGPPVGCGGGGSVCVLFDNFGIPNPNPHGPAYKHGNVSITNTSSPAGAALGSNLVGGDLTCSGNTSVTSNVPGLGVLPNTVVGQESGQCVGL